MDRSIRNAALLSATLLCVSTGPALAQIEQQTGTADPSRVQDRLRDQLEFPEAIPDVQVDTMSLQGAPDGAENINFTLRDIALDGITTYPEEELRAIFEDQLGQEISLAEIYAIANRLTLKYRNDGYVLTQVVIPPQTIENGIIRMQIVEGFIDNVIIQAPEEESNAAVNMIRDYAANIAGGGAVNVSELERGLLLINDLPGLSARSVLTPSETTPGAADLLIIVEPRDHWDFLVTADNFGSRYLGRQQYGAAATYRSLLGLNDSLTAQLVVAPGDSYELAFAALDYEQPIGPYGTRINLSGSKSFTEPGFDLEPFEVKGYSDLYSLKVTHPFIRTRNENLNAHIRFDWRDVVSRNNIPQNTDDRLRVLRAGLEYDFLDRLLGVAVNTVGFEVSHGLDIFGATGEGDFNISRAQGDPTFVKIEANAERLQRISDGVNVLVSARGQLANNPLLSSEEFSIGGVNSVRGFDPAEVSGDDGISGTIELQWNNPGNFQSKYIERYQLYGFLDGGAVWDQDATTSNAKKQARTGAGGGVRINFVNDLAAGIAVAFPLNEDVRTERDDDARVLLNLSKQF